MDDLVVDNKLATAIVDDQGADASATLGEGITDTVEETTLVNNRETLLDVTRFGHGNNAAVVTQVKDAVGLVDRAKHALDHNGWGWVGDEAGLLVQLAGEQVNTEITVLAGLGGDRDTDHLARTALEDQKITHADEVAGNGDGVAGVSTTGLDNTDFFTRRGVGRSTGNLDSIFLVVMVEWVHHVVGGTLNTAAEGVVLSVVIVVTHFAFWFVENGTAFGSNFGVGLRTESFVVYVTSTRTLAGFDASFVSAVVTGIDVANLGVTANVFGLVGGVGTAAIITFSDIDLGLVRLLAVDLEIDVALERAGSSFSVAAGNESVWVWPGVGGTVLGLVGRA